MNTRMPHTKAYGLSILLIIISLQQTYAYNLRQFSSKNGLSNSAILSMCQDSEGFMWFGSCDGLNMFDGVNFEVYKPRNEQNNLSGNLIEHILEADDNVLWVQTNYGLDRFDSRRRTLQTFREFKGRSRLAKSRENDVYVVKEDNYVYYYVHQTGTFKRVPVEGVVFEHVLDMAIDEENTLWLFLTEGRYKSYKLHRSGENLSLEEKNHFKHEEEVLWCFHEGNVFYFVDRTHALYEYNMLTKNKYFVKDIRAEVGRYGDISAILKHKNDYFMGFKSSGLICLRNTPEQKTRFYAHETEIKGGVFCLMKDRYQDIVWVGTDGQGVYMHFVNQYSIQSTLTNNMGAPVSNPVRALFVDKERTLWIGTKGDGIIRKTNYDALRNTCTTTRQLLTTNSALNNNSVYAFAPSRRNVLWIGSDNGLNYYSYREGRIKNIALPAGEKPLRYVHGVCEFNDSTLWLATVSEGIVKAELRGSADNPLITRVQRFVFDQGKSASNYFFTAYQENDSIIWFGNRGYGAYRMNNNTHRVDTYTFDADERNQTLNDIFAIGKTDEAYWFGTSYGLARLEAGRKTVFNEANGFPNNTVHCLLKDNHHNLWLSTNQGLVQFNTRQHTFRTYKQQNELEVIEFSDGAAFKDPLTGVLFFGGVNGFVTIIENEHLPQPYLPDIRFNKLTVFGKECNLHDFIAPRGNEELLQLDHSQNFFSIAFTAIDYINGNDYTYYYKLNELSESWIENGTSNRAAFTNILPGNYTLQVKYRNNITGEEGGPQTLHIRIMPPWYKTNVAWCVYAVLLLAAAGVAMRLSANWYRLKQNNIMEKLNRRQREEVYESKLRFFTNITHELCTPLTLIAGPCEKIIGHAQTDAYVLKYARLIEHNAEKLNSLIQELIEFRRLETGNKVRKVRRLSASGLVREVAEQFAELAETKGYAYTLNIAPDVMWNTDPGCLSKVVTNLLSNAFKYTNDHGTIDVALWVEHEHLRIAVTNTGKGIKEENIAKIFDRYTILDNLGEQSKKGSAHRNGLGLAICHNMVKLLEGEIEVKSVMNEATTFSVTLPHLAADEPEASATPHEPTTPPAPVRPEVLPVTPAAEALPPFDKAKQTILVVDDDPSMLWFITHAFMEHYNVMPVNDPTQVMPLLKKQLPDVIISDVMMPDIDGISLTKLIKADKLLKHIPLILLSAKHDAEEQVRGIDSGAEVYVTKPFNVEYLEKIVARMLQRKEDLKTYYASPLSAFELKEGKLTHVEDKEFLEKIIQTIESNIENPDLSAELLSSLLGMSARQLYRKLKEITEKTPTDIIKEQKLLTVERLLLTTNLSVDEIMYKTGFKNRGNFFKVFAQRFESTPKAYREQRKKEVLGGDMGK